MKRYTSVQSVWCKKYNVHQYHFGWTQQSTNVRWNEITIAEESANKKQETSKFKKAKESEGWRNELENNLKCIVLLLTEKKW